MTDRLQVISPRLLIAQVRIDACVSGCARQILPVLVGNVLALAVPEALGEPEVNDVDDVFFNKLDNTI